MNNCKAISDELIIKHSNSFINSCYYNSHRKNKSLDKLLKAGCCCANCNSIGTSDIIDCHYYCRRPPSDYPFTKVEPYQICELYSLSHYLIGTTDYIYDEEIGFRSRRHNKPVYSNINFFIKEQVYNKYIQKDTENFLKFIQQELSPNVYKKLKQEYKKECINND
jgi:hypothetical protein